MWGQGIAVTGDQLSIDSIGRSAKSVKESVGGVNIPWNAKVKDVELDAKVAHMRALGPSLALHADTWRGTAHGTARYGM